MPKKFEIEVFRDICFPELDSDEVAHALATVEIIKPYVEIINRNRKLRLNESHGDTNLDTAKRIRVALDTDEGMLYTGRHILYGDDSQLVATGIHLGSSKLCVVSSDSLSVVRTARHEMGHALYGIGIVGSTMDAVTTHCCTKQCVMYAEPVVERRAIQKSTVRRAAESLGLKVRQYEYVVDSIDFCSECNQALGKSAYVQALRKENPAFASAVAEALTSSS